MFSAVTRSVVRMRGRLIEEILETNTGHSAVSRELLKRGPTYRCTPHIRLTFHRLIIHSFLIYPSLCRATTERAYQITTSTLIIHS